jgi:dsDNA-specific endonuclease/ATPase MutS2
MSPIPWAAILTHGPTIVSAARSLLANQSSKINERHQSIEARLDQLEKASVETARLIQEMAEQQQALTLAQQDVQRRLRLAVIAGSVAAVVGVGAAILALVN